MKLDPFLSIRPLHDREVPQAIQDILQEKAVAKAVQTLIGEKASKQLFAEMQECKTIDEFKLRISNKLVWAIVHKTTFSLTLSGKSQLSPTGAYTYISNHRDIVLDSAFLSVLLADVRYTLPRIAIGDNLISRPWIEKVVKLNDSFVVRRNLGLRELASATVLLSQYVHHSLLQDERSIWIAQREGRAKDSNDAAQPAVIKMLFLGGTAGKTPLEILCDLKIVPTSISYEYDPCDWLKARELYCRTSSPEGVYQKAPHEDEFSMLQGIMGKKGRAHVALGMPLNKLLPQDAATMSRNELITWTVATLDQEIYKRYRLYPSNYIAYHLHSTFTSQYGPIEAGHFSAQEEARFVSYIDQRVAMAIAFDPQAPAIPEGLLQGEDLLQHPWYAPIRELLLEQYARPLINQRAAHRA